MSNLPQIAQLTFPDSDLNTQKINQQNLHTTFAWDFESGEFVLMDGKLVTVTGVEYLKVWIQKALLTVKNTLIYVGTGYGGGHYLLIGQNFHPDFEKAEYVRLIQEALLQNDAITGIESFTFSLTGEKLTISFTVKSIYGSTDQLVVI